MSYCPHCHAEIDYLSYSADYTEYGTEYGTCSVTGDDWECDERNLNDTENNGNTNYECPECNETLDPDDVLDELPEEDEDEEVSEEVTLTNTDNSEEDSITDGGHLITPIRSNNIQVAEGFDDYSIKCPECEKENTYTSGDETIICENCNCEIIT